MIAAHSGPELPEAAADRAAIDWLLACDEPGIRMQTRRDLLGAATAEESARVLEGPLMQHLLAGQTPDGGFGCHPYQKWAGAHWRLISMVELGMPVGEPRALAAALTVLSWLTGRAHRSRVAVIDGRVRRCASQEGNALAVCVRLGMAGDERVQLLADSLVGWQWPDGGWNCDRTPAAKHSSFHESLPPIWGLAEYARATGDGNTAQAAQRACDLLLDHHLFGSHTTGQVGDEKWLPAPYPPYWHYNVFHALTILARAGALPDARADEALGLLRQRQQADGSWHVQGAQYWRRSPGVYWDPAGWPRSGPSPMLTLNALRVLRASGR